MREGEYQKYLIDTIKEIYPDCVILKNDSGYQQGIPDLLVLWNDRWAMLEVKAAREAATQPNQTWWVSELNEMSFAAFIYPENESQVLYALQQSFETRRSARLSKRK